MSPVKIMITPAYGDPAGMSRVPFRKQGVYENFFLCVGSSKSSRATVPLFLFFSPTFHKPLRQGSFLLIFGINQTYRNLVHFRFRPKSCRFIRWIYYFITFKRRPKKNVFKGQPPPQGK